MGIIISCFKGMGKTYLLNILRDKISILDASSVKGDNIIPLLQESIDNYDIIIVSADAEIRSILNKNNVNFDIFYPSTERKNELIQNMVRKKIPPKQIQEFDLTFSQAIKEIDEEESPNMFKHKLLMQGEFLGNDMILRSYIDNLIKK